MHKINEGYKPRYSRKEMDRMLKTYTDNSYKCKCGHSVAIAKTIEKVICSYCGRYVFREKKDEFIYRLKEGDKMKKIKIISDDLKFIKGFAKIKVSRACRYYGYDQTNLMQGRMSSECERNVRKYIEKELADVRLDEVGDLSVEEDNSL